MTKIKNVEKFLKKRAEKDPAYKRLINKPPVLTDEQKGKEKK